MVVFRWCFEGYNCTLVILEEYASNRVSKAQDGKVKDGIPLVVISRFGILFR